MELQDLSVYARETYQLYEETSWSNQPGVSVIHARSGKWLAVLMKEYSEETGEIIERCDMKCGPATYNDLLHSYVTMPFLMKGSNWIGIVIDDMTDCEVVCRLFDRAVEEERKQGYTIVLDNNRKGQTNIYHSTPVPPSPYPVQHPQRIVPEKISQMKAMYKEYPGEPLHVSKARNFYHQAKFMEDYEDGHFKEWKGNFTQFFCTYHDLNTSQLISYFSWRTQVRRKNYRSACSSFIYMHIYELLNGIGVKDALDGYQKLCVIAERYFGPRAMYNQYNTIGRWIKDYAIYHTLSQNNMKKQSYEYDKRINHAVLVTSRPEDFTDEELFSAISDLSYRDVGNSILYKTNQDYMLKITSRVYRLIFEDDKQSYFRDSVTIMDVKPWEPFSNAVFYEVEKHADVDYVYNEVETYHCRDGKWAVENIMMHGIKDIAMMILHETDRVVRTHLRGYHKLKKKEEEAWVTPYVEKALAEERKEELERNIPKVNLDSAFLDKIRDDAAITREALLTEEEKEEVEEVIETKETVEQAEDDNLFILKTILSGQDVSEYIHAHHLLPSVITDAINEAFFDEIGDSILECDGETITFVEEYREDVEELLGGRYE